MQDEQTRDRADDVGAALARLLSHDLRSPLGPLVLAVSAISEDPGATPDVRELAAFAHAQCDRIARLISSTVTAVRGAGLPVVAPTGLSSIVEAAIAAFLDLGGSASVAVKEQFDVSIDAPGITRAFVGLLEAIAGDRMQATLSITGDGDFAVVRMTGTTGATADAILGATLPDSAVAVGVLGARAVLEAHGGSLRARHGGLEALLPRMVAA